MSTQSSDFTQEPKNIFVAFLMKYQSLAFYYIYVIIGGEARGLQILGGIISSLGEPHKKALKKYSESIRRSILRNGPKIDAKEMYDVISGYLNSTYYAECNVGVIPTSSLQGTEEVPDDKIATRVKAKI